MFPMPMARGRRHDHLVKTPPSVGAAAGAAATARSSENIRWSYHPDHRSTCHTGYEASMDLASWEAGRRCLLPGACTVWPGTVALRILLLLPRQKGQGAGPLKTPKCLLRADRPWGGTSPSPRFSRTPAAPAGACPRRKHERPSRLMPVSLLVECRWPRDRAMACGKSLFSCAPFRRRRHPAQKLRPSDAVTLAKPVAPPHAAPRRRGFFSKDCAAVVWPRARWATQ